LRHAAQKRTKSQPKTITEPLQRSFNPVFPTKLTVSEAADSGSIPDGRTSRKTAGILVNQGFQRDLADFWDGGILNSKMR